MTETNNQKLDELFANIPDDLNGVFSKYQDSSEKEALKDVVTKIIKYKLDIEDIQILISKYEAKLMIEYIRARNDEYEKSWKPLYEWSVQYMKDNNLTTEDFCELLGVSYFTCRFHSNIPSGMIGTLGLHVRKQIQKLMLESTKT